MHSDTGEETVSRLLALFAENPQPAMDEHESLLRCSSVCELAEILRAVYAEITEEMGIDWPFTALQWKLGNCGREQYMELSREARFMVWSLAFQGESEASSETRYTTCLPFCFKTEWIPHAAKSTSTKTST